MTWHFLSSWWCSGHKGFFCLFFVCFVSVCFVSFVFISPSLFFLLLPFFSSLLSSPSSPSPPVFHLIIQLSQHHLLKRLSFPNFGVLATFSKISWTYMNGIISVLSIVFHWPMYVSLYPVPYCFFFFFNLFMAVLGLRFCARAFSSCGKWGPLFIAVRGPLTIAASLVAEHRLQTRRLSSCGSRA